MRAYPRIALLTGAFLSGVLAAQTPLQRAQAILTATNTVNQLDVASLNQNIAALNFEAGRLTAEIERLNDQILTLEEQMAAHKQKRDELNTQVGQEMSKPPEQQNNDKILDLSAERDRHDQAVREIHKRLNDGEGEKPNLYEQRKQNREQLAETNRARQGLEQLRDRIQSQSSGMAQNCGRPGCRGGGGGNGGGGGDLAAAALGAAALGAAAAAMAGAMGGDDRGDDQAFQAQLEEQRRRSAEALKRQEAEIAELQAKQEAERRTAEEERRRREEAAATLNLLEELENITKSSRNQTTVGYSAASGGPNTNQAGTGGIDLRLARCYRAPNQPVPCGSPPAQICFNAANQQLPCR